MMPLSWTPIDKRADDLNWTYGRMNMPTSLNAAEMLDREYLELRCRLIDIAASLDRIARATGSKTIANDPRWKRVSESLRLLGQGGHDLAPRIQMIFSDEYVADWRE